MASPISFPQTDYIFPKTEYGQPDFQGIWNFASHTPVQRSEQYGNVQYYTAEEDNESRDRSVSSFEARAESHFDGVGGYNSFWYERAAIGYDPRTSLITYPENGRSPEIVERAFMQRGGVSEDYPSQRPVRFMDAGGIAKTAQKTEVYLKSVLLASMLARHLCLAHTTIIFKFFNKGTMRSL